MRITNNMIVNNVLRNINSNLNRVSKIQQQTSSGATINVASDDPVAAARILKLRNYLSKVEQYQKNTDDAISWIDVSDSALENIGESMQDIRDLVVEASNSGAYSEDDLAKIKDEIVELKKNILDLGNTSDSGRYVFAGYDTDSAPFEFVSTDVGEKVLYRGSYLSLGGVVSSSVSDTDLESFCLSNADNTVSEDKQEIEYKVGLSNRIAINEEGFEIFGCNGESIFDSIQKLELALDGETSYKTAQYSEGPPEEVTIETHELEIDDVLADLDNDIDRILTSRSELGAKYSYLELVKNRLDDNNTTYTSLLSKNEDVDYSEAAMRLSSAEAVYEASLLSGARVIQSSLLNFLD